LAAIPERLPRVKLPLTYRGAALLAAAVMLLLPIVYLFLIVLVVLGVAYHAMYDTEILTAVRGRAAILAFGVYCAPIIAGGILIFFMIKPIFARASNRGRTRSITRDGEPLLFQFVDRLCKAVGAPAPKRIQVDAQVNASAAFHRGLLSLIIGNDLVLTIGMPLIAGLNVRQFAGVLAHEFGHFSQGTGMRLTYIVRSISAWFMRVVYERDQWDEWLVDTAQQVDLRIGWILYLSQGCVWLTRRVLWVLMYVGNVVSGFLLRQMEFDADRYEAQLAGSETFKSTVYRLMELNVAQAKSQCDFGAFFRDGRLADNLPKLISINLARLPEEARRDIDKYIKNHKTSLFDTHPCDRDRIENAKRENAPGLFQASAPASVLFRHFDLLCRNVTWDTYCEVFGPQLKQDMLHPLDALLDLQTKQEAWKQELENFFLGKFDLRRPLPETSGHNPAPANLQAVRERLMAARQTLASELTNYSAKSDTYFELDRSHLEAQQMVALCTSGLKPDAVHFTNPVNDLSAARGRRDATNKRLMTLGAEMKAFEQAACNRLFACLGLLHDPHVTSKIRDADQMKREIDRLLPALQVMTIHHGKWLELRIVFATLGILCSQLERHHRNESLIIEIQKLMEKVAASLEHLREALVVDYPFDHQKGRIQVGQFLVSSIPVQELQMLFEGAEYAVDEFPVLYARIVGNLVAIAQRVESALHLPTLMKGGVKEVAAPKE
jgi:Zn-dependent protease with chaperone function